jgi:hypothetical protein
MVGRGNRRKVVALAVGALACLVCAAAPAQEPGELPAIAGGATLALRAVQPLGLNADRALFAQATRSLASQPTVAPQRRKLALEIPANHGTLIWRLGPNVDRPLMRDDPLGAGTWSVGLASVALAIHGARLYGVLGSDRCALAGDVDGGGMYGLVVQPFVNYNLPDGWYLMSVPVISADLMAPSAQRWTVPMGAGIGRSARLRDMPLSVQAGYYYNVEKPDGAPDWTLRLELRLRFRG